MPGLIHSEGYEADVAALVAANGFAHDVIDAIEWGLTRTTDFSTFELMHDQAKPPLVGAIRVTVFIPMGPFPGVLVVFGFEVNGGEEKIVLLNARPFDPESDDAG